MATMAVPMTGAYHWGPRWRKDAARTAGEKGAGEAEAESVAGEGVPVVRVGGACGDGGAGRTGVTMQPSLSPPRRGHQGVRVYGDISWRYE
ncbi:hypothetical protein GCM10027075_11040 [Streptomyces heilongjiangensis]